MATIKHISSKNADYGAAEKYLTFAHDEFSMKPTLDSMGRLIPREDYRMETVNCNGEDFALSCIRANLRYGKNSRREDIKSHHYIISFDPRDRTDNSLTVDKAQALGLAYCKEHFPGHQAIVCTHPDGHNHSGNIHVHIVINSLRISEVERKPYMDRNCDTMEGTKHRCTAAAFRYLRSEVMEMCHQAGLYQIDLLSGSKNRVTEREYWAKKQGQRQLGKVNAALSKQGLPPKQTKFETDKDKLRQSIRAALSNSGSFDDFKKALMQNYGIEIKESRGRYSYLTTDRTKPITARKLGDDFDKTAVLAIFAENAARAAEQTAPIPTYPASIKDRLQRGKATQTAPKQDGIKQTIDIQKKLSEGKGKGYEHWAKTFNLKQMAKSVNFLSEHGFASLEQLDTALQQALDRQLAASDSLKALEQRISGNKELMGHIATYRKTKPTYDGLKQAKRPEQYREQHRPDLARHEAAVQYFKTQGLKKLPAIPVLQAATETLISEKNSLYSTYRAEKNRAAELQKVKANLDTLLRREQPPEKRKDFER